MIETRRISPGDLDGFRTMNSVFSKVFDEPENYAETPPADTYAERWLADRDNFAVLSLVDGQPVGALAGYVLRKFEQERAEAYIYDLAVHEQFRRKGVATSMIEEVRRIAREAGAWTVFVQADVLEEDEPARALYRSVAHEEITALHFDIAP